MVNNMSPQRPDPRAAMVRGAQSLDSVAPRPRTRRSSTGDAVSRAVLQPRADHTHGRTSSEARARRLTTCISKWMRVGLLPPTTHSHHHHPNHHHNHTQHTHMERAMGLMRSLFTVGCGGGAGEHSPRPS